MDDGRGESDDQRAYRQWLVEAGHTASRDFDKALMTLAGGALGLSIAFIHQVVPNPVACSRVWVGLSWSLLVLSLVSILISLLMSQQALRAAIRHTDEQTIHQMPRAGGGLATATMVLNIVAASSLILGVVCLVIFALLNY